MLSVLPRNLKEKDKVVFKPIPVASPELFESWIDSVFDTVAVGSRLGDESIRLLNVAMKCDILGTIEPH